MSFGCYLNKNFYKKHDMIKKYKKEKWAQKLGNDKKWTPKDLFLNLYLLPVINLKIYSFIYFN